MDAFWDLLRRLNVERCEMHFHSCASWSLDAWGIACFGELGEACNEIKKIIRGDGNSSRLAAELADAVIYSDLLLHRVGFSLAAAGWASIEALDGGYRYQESADRACTRPEFAESVGVHIVRASRRLYLGSGDGSFAIMGAGDLLAALWRGFGLAGVKPVRAITEKFDEVSRRVGYSRSLAMELDAIAA
jgi:hypothetical protein